MYLRMSKFYYCTGKNVKFSNRWIGKYSNERKAKIRILFEKQLIKQELQDYAFFFLKEETQNSLHYVSANGLEQVYYKFVIEER